MIDMKPLGDFIVVGVALMIAVALLVVASIFVRVEMWWTLPVAAFSWMVLKLTTFKD